MAGIESRIGGSAHEQERYVHEVTPEFLIKFFLAEQFQNLLSKSLQRYRKSKNTEEFGFEVLKRPDAEQLFFGKVVGGDFDEETDLKKSSDAILKRLRKEGVDPYTFSTFHLHPHQFENDPIIIPSGTGGDLGRSNMIRRATEGIINLSVPSIDLIGTIKGDKTIKILAFREPVAFDPGRLSEAFEEMCDGLDYVQSQEEVLALLRQLKYEAVLLNSDTDGRFDQVNIEQLGTLAYQPKKVA